ncbi:dihydroneopterin aldolase [Mucilaginibacter terrae]|uniref:dihydroneopterin aldolase n=1 Tax=Mucilaginibacter terrae TaxID=1955052 RepID=UPI0036323134
MIKVGLHGAEFFARHGYYKEEQVLGNYFIVDIEACFMPQSTAINDDLDNTLNYERLYQVTAEQMKHPQKLLETVAQSIADRIMQLFPYINNLLVTVKKLNPPLKGKVVASSVTITVNV